MILPYIVEWRDGSRSQWRLRRSEGRTRLRISGSYYTNMTTKGPSKLEGALGTGASQLSFLSSFLSARAQRFLAPETACRPRNQFFFRKFTKPE
jgi:hypothetical protein